MSQFEFYDNRYVVTFLWPIKKCLHWLLWRKRLVRLSIERTASGRLAITSPDILGLHVVAESEWDAIEVSLDMIHDLDRAAQESTT